MSTEWSLSLFFTDTLIAPIHVMHLRKTLTKHPIPIRLRILSFIVSLRFVLSLILFAIVLFCLTVDCLLGSGSRSAVLLKHVDCEVKTFLPSSFRSGGHNYLNHGISTTAAATPTTTATTSTTTATPTVRTQRSHKSCEV